MTDLDLSMLVGPNLKSTVSKYLDQSILFVDYMPFFGPIYNATYALKLLYSIWQGKTIDHTGDSNSRVAREKGLTAVVTALIDIFTMCLAVGVIDFVCNCLTRIQTFSVVRELSIGFIMANILALAIGSKIIASQLVIHLTRQLEEVNHVSTSMVKSVTITASAIERIVETTNSTTGVMCQQVTNWYDRVVQIVFAIFTWPRTVVRQLQKRTLHQVKKPLHKFIALRGQLRISVGNIKHYARLAIYVFFKLFFI